MSKLVKADSDFRHQKADSHIKIIELNYQIKEEEL